MTEVKMPGVPVALAARIMCKGNEFVRCLLQAGRVPWGTATPPETPGGRWNYYIYPNKFEEFFGLHLMDIPEYTNLWRECNETEKEG